MGSKSAVARKIGMSQHTLSRRLLRGRLGYYKATKRSGLCNYCRGWELDEQPHLQRLWSSFQEETAKISQDFWNGWAMTLEAAATSGQVQHRPFTCVRWWKLAMAFVDRQAREHPLAARSLAVHRPLAARSQAQTAVCEL